MNHGLAEPAIHWSTTGSILPGRTAADAPTCEVLRDFISSPVWYATSPAGTAVLKIARKIAGERPLERESPCPRGRLVDAGGTMIELPIRYPVPVSADCDVRQHVAQQIARQYIWRQ